MQKQMNCTTYSTLGILNFSGTKHLSFVCFDMSDVYGGSECINTTMDFMTSIACVDKICPILPKKMGNESKKILHNWFCHRPEPVAVEGGSRKAPGSPGHHFNRHADPSMGWKSGRGEEGKENLMQNKVIEKMFRLVEDAKQKKDY